MKKKSFFVSLMLLVCAFVLFGCTPTTKSNVVQTNLGIYDLYYDHMIIFQNGIKNDISPATYNSNTDKTRVNYVVDKLNLLEQDELAIIASVECYNMLSLPKEINLNIDNGLINVKQQNRNFICTITRGDEVDVYDFSISKNTNTNKYTINYQKTINEQTYDCKGYVVFDKTTSYISSEITSYTDDGEKVEIKKEFYCLINDYGALRINIAIGAASNRPIYGVDLYKEIASFKTKISSKNAFDSKISVNNLTKDNFISTSSSDNVAYIISYNEGQPRSVEMVGETNKW